ncbi:MAG: hypothetical protein Kow0098_22020 [Ignavibacteriaceae bacterium]
MKAVMVLMKYDYGVKSRGYSYEYYNLFLPVKELLGEENVIHFDFYDEFLQSGKAAMNKKLKELMVSEKPDFSIFVLFENEFEESVINSLKDVTITTAYFIDDPWRQSYADHWRKYFNFSTTPDYYMYLRYKAEKIPNVIFCPFGFNPSVYKKADLPQKYEISFVGGFSPYRKWVLNLLRKDGIKVNVFGRGWDSDKNWVSQEKMVEIFNSSAINLNLSNAVNRDISFVLNSLFSFKSMKELILLKKHREQVKGRHFEINGCGGFQLSCYVPGLNEFYLIDREIAVFDNPYNLAEMIKLYMNDDKLRTDIASGGYVRSHREHTAHKYLKNLINIILPQK